MSQYAHWEFWLGAAFGIPLWWFVIRPINHALDRLIEKWFTKMGWIDLRNRP